MRVGLGIPPIGLPITLCTEIVRQAEARGFDSIWVGEAWGTETCALAGALLLVLVDAVARTVAAPVEIPVGVLTALAGAPWPIVVLQQISVGPACCRFAARMAASTASPS